VLYWCLAPENGPTALVTAGWPFGSLRTYAGSSVEAGACHVLGSPSVLPSQTLTNGTVIVFDASSNGYNTGVAQTQCEVRHAGPPC
jgi:hypothetical protein